MKNSNMCEQIDSMIIIQQNLITILLGNIEKIVSSSNDIDLKYSDDVIKILEGLKDSLSLCNKNIALLQDKKKEIETNNNDNINYFKTINMINTNIITIETFLQSLLKFTMFKFSDTTDTTSSTKDELTIDNLDLKENTLIISETSGQVILPYTKIDLDKLKQNDNKTYEEIIQENYTLPIDLFKTPFVARFREAFKLAHTKEKKSIKFAFNLGTELLFNYNLHPAIITACRDLDELDIYLDYLESNETEKFECFNIIFEIPPVISKRKSSKYDF